MPENAPQSMAGKRVLVTGSGTGIGRGIALGFAAAGASVALHYSHGAEGGTSAVAQIRQAGGKAELFHADFDEVAQVERLARQAVDFLGGLDVLVNNAGITFNRPIEAVTPAQFDRLYHVNVRAPFFMAQAVLPALKASGGEGGTAHNGLTAAAASIINISSIHALSGCREHSVYAGTRGAIVSFTRSLAIELAPVGVRVNAIAPGSVYVERYLVDLPGFDRVGHGREIPAGFVADPADIAGVALFLASDAARYIVGQTLVVDGGTTSWMPFGEGFKKTMGIQFGKGYVPDL